MFARRWLRPIQNQRGSALVTVAVSLTAMFSAAALAIDLGILFVARSEAQRAADAASLAATVALIEQPDNPERAREIAAAVAAANTVRGLPVDLLPQDIEIEMGSDTSVSIVVHRTEERGSPVSTLFAKMFGVDAVDVAAAARSEPYPTGAATCIKPFMVPDAWDDADADGVYDPGEYYDPDVTGYGTDWRRDGYERDFGRPILLYPGEQDKRMSPSWYFLYRLPGSAGAADLRNTIQDTRCANQTLKVGEMRDVDTEPGKKTGPVDQGIQALIDEDPGAYWDEMSGTVRGSKYGDAWRASPRVMNIVTFDPTQVIRSGMTSIQINSFITVFLEQSRGGGRVVGRFLPVVGVGDATDCRTNDTCSAFARYAKLTG